jgi:hypothetical protein
VPNNLCHRELQRVYRDYNRRWFQNALPDDVDCMFAPTVGCLGLVELDNGGWLLTIDPKYAIEGRTWRLTLLHEQAHLLIAPYKLHGKQFQMVMQGLAMCGAFRQLW